jgi:voltage-gated potassium channel
MYFAVVTLTTLGFGDVTPQTDAGRFLTAAVSMLGYAIIAVPTGIVSAEIAQARRSASMEVACPRCGTIGHDSDAVYCRRCGGPLPGT